MSRPNILIILSDQHNPRIAGCYGDPLARTPNIDRLASAGAVFDSAYCGSPLCVPSRATMLTGRSCSELGVWTNKCVLPSSVPTFAHSLGAAGYDTALIGRMHFSGADTSHGFARRLVGDVSPAWGWGPWAVLDGLPVGTNGQEYISTAVSGAGRTGYQVYDSDVTAAAVDWLADRGTGQSTRPFCAVVGLVLPHNPYVAPERWYDYYLPRVSPPAVPAGFAETVHPAVRAWMESRQVGEITAEQSRSALAAYYGLVSVVDEQVGEIMAALESSGMRDETVVVYTSDHGDMAGELGLWWKSSCYDGAARVPLVAAGPGVVTRRVADPVSLLDLAPTLVDLAGADPLPATSGRVVTPLLAGAPLSPEATPEIYLENVPEWAPSARMVRRGRHKLVRHHGYERPQLFDLETDPHELVDLAGDAAHAGVIDELDAMARSGWDPDEIHRSVARHRAERGAISAWSHAVHPPDGGVWPRAGEPGLNVLSRLTGPSGRLL
jgi:choline-sulfatase